MNSCGGDISAFLPPLSLECRWTFLPFLFLLQQGRVCSSPLCTTRLHSSRSWHLATVPSKLCFFSSFTIQLKPHLNLGKLPCYISIRPASCHFSHCDAPVWLIPDWYEKASSLWFYFHSTSLQISVSAISCWNSPYLSEHCKKCLRTPLKMAEKGWVPASCPGFALDTPQPQSILGISSFHFRTGRPPCRDRKPFFQV